jgi:hypothetical protein
MTISDILHYMPYGRERRKLIMKYLKDPLNDCNLICVNRKWCIQTKSDPDIKKLLKKKKLVMIREGTHRSRTSFLTLPKSIS